MTQEGGGVRSKKTRSMLAFDRRLDNARRNVDGRKPLSLIEAEERRVRVEAERLRRLIVAHATAAVLGGGEDAA